MEIIKDLDNVCLTNTAVTIGKFDGLHNGHQIIMGRLKAAAKYGLKTLVFTFTKAPSSVVSGDKSKYIYTEEEKYFYYQQTGVDYLVECEAKKEIFDMKPRDFVEKILVNKLGMSYFCSGTDFRFGKNRMGDVKLLKTLGSELSFKVETVEKKQYHQVDISSTRVRQMIIEGNMEEALAVMGHPYAAFGKIIKGNQLGRTVGMPTINMVPSVDKIIPPNGVYATKIYLGDKEYKGITNVGYKPTVSNKCEMGIETYIFDFDMDVYGMTARVDFIHYIRPEKKFPSLEKVKEQVNMDIVECRKIFDISNM